LVCLLFGNKFIELIGWSPAKLEQVGNQNHVKEYLFAFLSSLVLVYVLAYFVQYTKANNAVAGMQTGFWLWLGFIATTQLATVIFEERPLGLYLINIGYQFVACLLTGALLAAWKPRAAVVGAGQPA
jgi:biotin transporter BioY